METAASDAFSQTCSHEASKTWADTTYATVHSPLVSHHVLLQPRSCCPSFSLTFSLPLPLQADICISSRTQKGNHIHDSVECFFSPLASFFSLAFDNHSPSPYSLLPLLLLSSLTAWQSNASAARNLIYWCTREAVKTKKRHGENVREHWWRKRRKNMK